FFRYPQSGMIKTVNIENLEIVALIHTLGAFLLITFLIVHLYLITTGHTITSNLKAMITGWEELEEDTEETKQEN
ncbi:MAG TPA: hypothetical protein PK785_04700, partial [Bacteroidales bacterium]|nr:hypothetical protein [Bacteroidales bacterium]